MYEKLISFFFGLIAKDKLFYLPRLDFIDGLSGLDTEWKMTKRDY